MRVGIHCRRANLEGRFEASRRVFPGCTSASWCRRQRRLHTKFLSSARWKQRTRIIPRACRAYNGATPLTAEWHIRTSARQSQNCWGQPIRICRHTSGLSLAMADLSRRRRAFLVRSTARWRWAMASRRFTFIGPMASRPRSKPLATRCD